MRRLQDFYQKTVIKELMKKFKYKNVMQVPKLEKITINMGVGVASVDKKLIQAAFEDMNQIAGQRGVITKARKANAGFKIREGWPIGCKVTLRRDKMYDFFDRLVSIAIPRIRDFRGFSVKSFDSFGNYSLGLKEQIVFPEIDFDKVDKLRGMDVTITTTAKTDEEGMALLAAFDFPFKDYEDKK